MRAVVLVGGEGTRLRPLTWSVPKQMLPVAGRPMLERVLGQLARHGVDEAVLSLGYLPDAFARAYPEGVVAGVRVAYAVEPEALDTAGAIRFAAEHAGVDERFVVLNGDVLTDIDLHELLDFHGRHGAEGTVALHAVDEPSAFGVVPTDEEGRVTAFVEKPLPGTAPTNLINAGLYVLEPSVLGRIASGRRVSVEREVFPAMVLDGTLFARPDHAYWLDTGTPEAYLRAQFDILDGHRPWIDPPAPGARQAAPGVWTTGEVRAAGEVRGPALLGDGVVVEDGAAVTRAVLGAGCAVRAGASVTGSVLMDGVTVAEGAKVEGSVVGGRATLGAGCRVLPLSVVGFDATVEAGASLEGARLPA